MSRHDKRMLPLLTALHEAWMANPDWRLGQLISNAGQSAGRSDPFYVEDDELEQALTALAMPSASTWSLKWPRPEIWETDNGCTQNDQDCGGTFDPERGCVCV